MLADPLKALVVDASAAVAVVAGEHHGEAVTELLSARRRLGAELLVPDHFWLEVVNALAIGYRASAAVVVEAVAELDATGIQSINLDRPQVLLVIDAIARYGLTAYDAGYLVLAESADAQILTLDARLAAAAGDRAVRLGGGHSIGEENPPYAAPAEHATWASWPGAAAYLRELRARIQPGVKSPGRLPH